MIRARDQRRSPSAGVRLLGLLVLAAGTPQEAFPQVLLTQDEALGSAFPEPATVERATAFLSDDQLEEARVLAGDGVQLSQRVVTYYVGRTGNGQLLGVAYFDAHRVRTMREVAMIVVSPRGLITRVDVLSFFEPPEYMASRLWVEQLMDRTLTDDLAVGRGIINLTGATLTASALTSATRRVLALHQVIRPLQQLEEGGGG